jgi:hypothetical protein
MKRRKVAWQTGFGFILKCLAGHRQKSSSGTARHAGGKILLNHRIFSCPTLKYEGYLLLEVAIKACESSKLEDRIVRFFLYLTSPIPGGRQAAVDAGPRIKEVVSTSSIKGMAEEVQQNCFPALQQIRMFSSAHGNTRILRLSPHND